MTRDSDAHRLIRALHLAFENAAGDDRALAVVTQAFTGYQTSPSKVQRLRQTLPACSHLGAALTSASRELGLWGISEACKLIASDLDWYQTHSPSHPKSASANFWIGHANATLYGPGSLVSSDRLRIGMSLLAPDVRHPDHSHAPAKMYLVVSEGEFRKDGSDWAAPGYRGSLYTEAEVVHAMRSGPKPLLAFWALGHDL
ncbi:MULTISPECIES: dimethylsulfonioproprionate lyase family protein [Pseudomonas]|uniref:dimethylsulfonioproprionate lyase family protein n=1 Tax=Pseudomonas TaxID=286 RepID=UPI000B4F80B3|nr:MULTISPECIES: dimethylsulfonioproprionate lyase family protein [Pseudomonas]POA89323.1 transcriptional regulator [Pseudomonas sp. FW305-E2]PYB93676.1 transcriptional regulator [Pseudomonas fulva]PYC16502.1 transcriptional regulator [Pseudomonas fulva]HEK0905519.1 hypothetical protein [Pseudomonas putida]